MARENPTTCVVDFREYHRVRSKIADVILEECKLRESAGDARPRMALVFQISTEIALAIGNTLGSMGQRLGGVTEASADDAAEAAAIAWANSIGHELRVRSHDPN